MRIPAFTLTAWALWCVVASAEEDTVTKADLSLESAKAIIAELQEDGYLIKDIDVESDGKQPKFTLKFARTQVGTRFNLGTTHADLDKEMREAERRGGVLPTCLKGYRVGNNVFFAVIFEVIGPEGSGSNYVAKVNVPAPDFQPIVDGERSRGGKLADQSTYVAPDGKTYHTLLFHPRQ